MKFQREFFDRVPKTIMPRPYFAEENDVLGQKGTAWAVDANVYGDNCYCDRPIKCLWRGIWTRLTSSAVQRQNQRIVNAYWVAHQEKRVVTI